MSHVVMVSRSHSLLADLGEPSSQRFDQLRLDPKFLREISVRPALGAGNAIGPNLTGIHCLLNFTLNVHGRLGPRADARRRRRGPGKSIFQDIREAAHLV